MDGFLEGNLFNGKSYAEMINSALGTKYESYRRSAVELSNDKDIIAWFVYLDGSVYGYYHLSQDDKEQEYLWRNIIKTENGEEYIYEEFLGEFEFIFNKIANSQIYPYRLAFSIDPFESGNKYSCQFKGVYCLDAFWGKDNMNKRFKKVSDRYLLYDANPKKEVLKAMPILHESVDKLGLSERTLNKIKSFGITRINEVLELGFGGMAMSKELLKSVQRFFALSVPSSPPKVLIEPLEIDDPQSYIGAIVKNERHGVGWIKAIENGYVLVVF